MNWIDTVNESILAWPTLYLKETWEKSAFAVAHHFFIVLGNGIEWANTKDPAKGGYLTYPRSYRRHGDWVQKLDTPYRKKSKISLNPGIFDPSVKKYNVQMIDHEDSAFCKGHIRGKRSPNRGVKKLFTEDELSLLGNSDKILILSGNDIYLTRYSKAKHENYVFVAEEFGSDDDIFLTREDSGPYPNFQKTYSCFWEIEPELIKPDWKEAALAHLQYWKTWFDDEKNHVKYSYCPSNPQNQVGDKLSDSIKKWHPKYFKLPPDEFVKKIQTEYNCPIFTGDNWDELNAYNWLRHLEEVKTFLTETIKRLS